MCNEPSHFCRNGVDVHNFALASWIYISTVDLISATSSLPGTYVVKGSVYTLSLQLIAVWRLDSECLTPLLSRSFSCMLIWSLPCLNTYIGSSPDSVTVLMIVMVLWFCVSIVVYIYLIACTCMTILYFSFLTCFRPFSGIT